MLSVINVIFRHSYIIKNEFPSFSESELESGIKKSTPQGTSTETEPLGLGLSCFRFAFYEHFCTFFATVSHIPQFGDAASPAGYVDVSAGDAHL